MKLKKEVKRNIWIKVLKAPLVLLIIASFIGSIYAAAKNISGVTAGTPVLFGLLIILYIWAIYLEKK